MTEILVSMARLSSSEFDPIVGSEMEAYLIDWLSLIFRWVHVITGIAWIGASFYFIWLDNHLQEPPEWKKNKGIKGDLWAIHGGYLRGREIQTFT